MTQSDDESTLSTAPSTVSNPFSIAARSTTSSFGPQKNTRHRESRLPVVQKPVKSTPSHLLPRPRASDDYSPLATVPTMLSQSREDADLLAAELELEQELELQDNQSSFMDGPSPAPGSSVSQNSGNSTKYTRPKTSDIYSQVAVELRQGTPFFICNHCRKPFKKNGGTRVVREHLKKYHQWNPEVTGVALERYHNGVTVEEALLRQGEIAHTQQEQRQIDLLSDGVDKATLEYLYIQWIVADDLPFELVSHNSFRALLEYINPKANELLPRSPQTIRAHAMKLFEEGKQRLRYILATAISDIHVTCDMWTSPNHLGILAIVGHFTSENLERRAVTLALVEIQGEHSGQNQAIAVFSVLKDFGVVNHLGYFVMDNASSNDTLIEFIANALKEEGVRYNYTQRRLRCNGHVINLSVQAFLFGKVVNDYEYPENMSVAPNDVQLNKWRKLGPLGRLHNIVVYIMGSPQRIQAFKRISDGLMPHRDNGTRWNSWYGMLDWAIRKIKGAIITLTNEDPALKDDVLSAKDWIDLAYIRDFLQGFHDATKMTESLGATLDRVLPTMDFLIERFESAATQFMEHHELSESIQTGYTKMLKYWNKTERAPVYIAAIVLDPTIKYTYFDDWDPEWYPYMKQDLKAFWEDIYRSSTGLANRSAEAPTIQTDNEFIK